MRQLAAFILGALLLFGPALPVAGAAEPPVTRGEFVQLLWEEWGSVPYWDTHCFSDLPPDAPYTAALCWAYDMGFVLGVGDGCFQPDRPITREEAAVFLRRAASHIGRDTVTFFSTAECNDYADISPWADDSLYWATAIGLIDWTEEGLRAPLGAITPDEAAAILQRFDTLP